MAAAVKRERVRLTVVHKFELEGLEGSFKNQMRALEARHTEQDR